MISHILSKRQLLEFGRRGTPDLVLGCTVFPNSKSDHMVIHLTTERFKRTSADGTCPACSLAVFTRPEEFFYNMFVLRAELAEIEHSALLWYLRALGMAMPSLDNEESAWYKFAGPK